MNFPLARATLSSCFSKDAQATQKGTELGGFKQLGQVLVFDIKTDGSVPRRISLTS